MPGPESVLPPGASSGMGDILLRTSCCKISLPLRNAPGGNTDSGPTNTYSRHSSQTCSGADANLVARQSRALIWGGRSQSSGLTNFPIRLSERSRNLTPLCRVNAGPALVLLFRTFRRTEEAPQRVARSGASDMSEDVLKSNTRRARTRTTDYRSMCDSLIGNGSAKWQAQQWPGATSLNSGSFSEQMPCAIGQRV